MIPRLRMRRTDRLHSNFIFLYSVSLASTTVYRIVGAHRLQKTECRRTVRQTVRRTVHRICKCGMGTLSTIKI